MTQKLSELLESVPGERKQFRDVVVSGVTCDSRRVNTGDVFVAVPGTMTNGMKFVNDAIGRGCSAVVSEKSIPGLPVPLIVVPDARTALAEMSSRFYDHPTAGLNVVGVTGTNGKTTVTWLLHAIFEAAGEKAGQLGTIAHMIGNRTVPSETTTPGADVLKRYFWEMKTAGCRSAAMEVSSHALAQDRSRGVRFAAAVFTNLTRDHLDYHPSFEAYRDAKGKLFEGLSGKAVLALNADDPACEHYRKRTSAHVVTYSLIKARADVLGRIELATFNGTRLQIRLGTEKILVQTRLIGTHNVSNILGAAACAWAMGYDLEHIKEGIENLTSVPGRLESVEGAPDFGVFVDYAHTEDALQNVMQFVRPLLKGRLIVVFGCGGDRDRGKRPRMARIAERFADQVVLTSDNPRGEDPLRIIRDAAAGFKRKESYFIEPDRRAAIRLAISRAQKGGVVLLAGKGHEAVQIFSDGPRPFDDREIAREYLKELLKRQKK